jgi:hypothetical protein
LQNCIYIYTNIVQNTSVPVLRSPFLHANFLVNVSDTSCWKVSVFSSESQNTLEVRERCSSSPHGVEQNTPTPTCPTHHLRHQLYHSIRFLSFLVQLVNYLFFPQPTLISH